MKEYPWFLKTFDGYEYGIQVSMLPVGMCCAVSLASVVPLRRPMVVPLRQQVSTASA